METKENTKSEVMTSENGNGFTIIDLGTSRLGTESRWNIESETGYKPQTTFWQDLAIADAFGPMAVAASVASMAEAWKENAVYITELSMVLNHRGWMHYHAGRKAYANVYFAAWQWLVDKITGEWLKGEDLVYYYETTD